MLVDAKGLPIPYAYSFDDETNEVEIFLTGKDEQGHTRVVTRSVPTDDGSLAWETVKVKTILTGAKLVDKDYKIAPPLYSGPAAI